MIRPNSTDRSAKPKLQTRLEKKLDARLFAYAAAASAAGVSLFAVTQSAEAKIVYTPANVSMPTNAYTNLDLNNDGVPDFAFYFYAYGPRKPLGYHEEALQVDPLKTGNAIWGVPNTKVGECAAALPAGAKIGAGAPFQSQQLPIWGSGGTAYSGPFYVCDFAQKTRGAFLGLKFVINGETHYGWAHVTVSHRDAVLQGYAYETVPNQPIFAGKTSGPSSISESNPTPIPIPQPATVGLLAQGSRGLSLWRKPEEEQRPEHRNAPSLG
jgi:hypothetical protein